METPDVLVLGLGPAGASAAAEAARLGCKVVALDRKREALLAEAREHGIEGEGDRRARAGRL